MTEALGFSFSGWKTFDGIETDVRACPSSSRVRLLSKLTLRCPEGKLSSWLRPPLGLGTVSVVGRQYLDAMHDSVYRHAITNSRRLRRRSR